MEKSCLMCHIQAAFYSALRYFFFGIRYKVFGLGLDILALVLATLGFALFGFAVGNSVELLLDILTWCMPLSMVAGHEAWMQYLARLWWGAKGEYME